MGGIRLGSVGVLCVVGVPRGVRVLRVMLRVIALWVSVSVLSAAGCERLPDAPIPAPPRLELTETRHDFGSVAQGHVVTWDFRLRNTGGRELLIEELRTGCDCAATSSTQTVPPGGAARIRARFDTGDVFGPQRRTITLYTSDPERPAVVVEMTGDVSLDVAADPPQLYLGGVRRGQTAPGFSLLVGGDAEIRSVEGAARLAVAAVDLDDGRRGARVRITVRSDAASGPFREEIVVRTTSARRPSLRVPVTGRVEAPDREH